MMKALVGMGAALMSAACSTVGVRTGTEEPSYQVVSRVDDLEVRRYGDRIAAQTVVSGDDGAARNRGFQRLAGYIFGGNATRASIAMTAPVAQAGTPGSEKIAMTAPVAQVPAGPDRWTIQFFMPAEYALADLPVPNDPTVQLVAVPGETFAVLRFSGVGSTGAVEAHKQTLMTGLAAGPWRAVAEPVVWFYDPPWTLPPLRRNEVAVRVEPR
jgi:SOUL heme-binding protein